MRFFFVFFLKHLLKITAEVLAVEILKFHVSAQVFKMFSAFSAAEIAALGFLAVSKMRRRPQTETVLHNFLMFLLKC